MQISIFDAVNKNKSKEEKKSKIDTFEYHVTQDTIWESDKSTRKHNIQENIEVSTFPAGDHRAARNRQDSITDMKHNLKKMINKRRTTLVLPLKIENTCLTAPTTPLFLVWIKTNIYLVRMKVSIYHLLVNTNRDLKKMKRR